MFRNFIFSLQIARTGVMFLILFTIFTFQHKDPDSHATTILIGISFTFIIQIISSLRGTRDAPAISIDIYFLKNVQNSDGNN